MRVQGSKALSAALLLALTAGGSEYASAQAERTWTDPPADPAAPAAPAPIQPAPAPAAPLPAPAPAPAPPAAAPPARSVQPARPPAPPPVVAQPRRRESAPPTARGEAAKAFAAHYLASWSAPNPEAIAAIPTLYAPRVLFHGRTVSLNAILDEKRRFAARWPERSYTVRPDSTGVVCNPASDVCTVHAMFDFRAENQAQGRRSEGSGALQLIVEFVGERPMIVAEHSTVVDRGGRRNLRFGASGHD